VVSACFSVPNAVSAASIHWNVSRFRRLVRGVAVVLKSLIKRL
jgi:hypothetical protein